DLALPRGVSPAVRRVPRALRRSAGGGGRARPRRPPGGAPAGGRARRGGPQRESPPPPGRPVISPPPPTRNGSGRGANAQGDERSALEPARGADGGVLPVLVLAPDLDDDARAPVLPAHFLDHAVDGEPVAGVDRLHERDRHRPALDEAGPED